MANEEKKCKYCAMMIPKEAKICPFCRKDQGTSTATGCLVVIILASLMMAVVTLMIPSGPSTPTPSVDPSTISDRQVFREYEICMQYAEETIKDNKLKGQDMAVNCFSQLQKYGKERAKKAFATYYDLSYKEKK